MRYIITALSLTGGSYSRPLLAFSQPLVRLLSRSAFLRSTILLMSTSTSSSLQGLSPSQPIQSAAQLLQSVYGPVTSPSFPLPMPKEEAGLCADGHQRRYLWTDAFGVMAYTSLADYYEGSVQAQEYRTAADKLIDVVHQCLGRPRTNRPEDAMQPFDPKSPTGHVGLRIGKAASRKVTDYGMKYDGMYWHYIDKWLLALCRAGHEVQAVDIAKSVFPFFFDAGPHGDGRTGGIRWKLSVDATPPSSLERAHASDDALIALIVFSLLQSKLERDYDETITQQHNLQGEIRLLRNSLEYYRPRVTDDPLGWGLEALFDQYLDGQPRKNALASLASSALAPYHLSLPFRLYGAILGARVAGESVASPAIVDDLIKLSLEHEKEAKASGFEEHSSINRVMLAMCLLTPGGVLDRQPGDPLIRL
jgi:hypothetical protein